MKSKILIKNGTVITNDKNDTISEVDILIVDDRIRDIRKSINDEYAYIIDAKGKFISPGFIQPHVHLTQTLFKGRADDLELMDFLKNKIWKFEAAHTFESNYISAKLGIVELISSGTTSFLDMGTVNHHDAVFQAIYDTGIRGISGKCMMDFGEGVPKQLLENTKNSLEKSLELLKKWHGKDNNRIKYALAPRFAVSCTDEMFRQIKTISEEYGILIHTHASENKGEIDLVYNLKKQRNLEYFHSMGLTGENLVLAHCVWLNENEINIIKETGTKVVHCPNSNLKLASGFSMVPELIKEGICVSLAMDSASCNNSMSMFGEMKTAALIHKARLLSPTIMDAKQIFKMATIEGAKAINESDSLGSIEVGKKADIILLNLDMIGTMPYSKDNLYSTIVYSGSSQNVETVIIDGKVIMENYSIKTLDIIELLNQTKSLTDDFFKK